MTTKESRIAREFTVDDLNLKVRRPNLDEIRESQKIFTKTFHDALSAGAVLRAKLDDVLKSQGLWDDKKEIEIRTLQQEIANLEVLIRKGGNYALAEKAAFDIIDKRDRIKEIFAVRLLYDNRTAEGQAEEARTDYLVSVCLVYNDKEAKPYFKNLEDYLNSQNTNVAIEGYKNFLMLINDTDDNPEQDLIEYKFLKKFKRLDNKFRLLNKDGHLIDRDGRLIDENGRYVGPDGSFVDINGNPVDKDGNYSFEKQPFLDENGNPILDDEGNPILID